MTDLESRVTAALAGRAQRSYEVDRLRERAVRKAKGIRRRRRVLGTAAAAIVAVGAFAFAPGGDGAPAASTLPLETAAPPGGIGSDRGLIHFDVDWARMPATLVERVVATEWASGEGYEQVIARDAAAQGDARKTPVFRIALFAERDRFEEWIAEHDAGDTRALGWQSGNVFGAAVVDRDDRDLLPRVVSAVTFDRVQRCVMPLRLAELPGGATWSECQTTLRQVGAGPVTGWVSSGLTIRRSDGNTVYIWADGRPLGSPSPRPDRTVAGYPALWLSRSGSLQTGLWVLDFGPYHLFVTSYEDGPSDWFTPEVAAWYTERLTPSPDLNDPNSWPRRAAG